MLVCHGRCSAAVVAFASWICLSVAGAAQSLEGWTLKAPDHTIQLLNVASSQGGGLRFTIQNVSAKTIVHLLIGARQGRSEELSGLDAFTTGVGKLQPGATIYVDLNAGPDTSELYLEALVWSDGSHTGNSKYLARVEDQMISATLETRRAAGILAETRDSDANAAETAVSRIGATLPQTPADAASSLRGIDLPGISDSYLDQHLSQENRDLLVGLGRARQAVLRDIGNQARLASSAPTRSKVLSAAIQHAQTAGFADLAVKYQALSAEQIKALSGFIHQEEGR